MFKSEITEPGAFEPADRKEIPDFFGFPVHIKQIFWYSSTCKSYVYSMSEVKVLVTQLCPILCNPMYCSPPGSSVFEIFQARILEWVAHSLLQGTFPTQGLGPGLLHCRQILYHLSHQFALYYNLLSLKEHYVYKNVYIVKKNANNHLITQGNLQFVKKHSICVK